MKKLFVSAGLVAIGAAAMESSSMADDVTGPKYWSVGATLRGFYDDNYSINGANKGSFGVELLPTVSAHVPLRQTDLGLRYTYGAYWYQDRQISHVNAWDQTHDLDLWVDHAFNERWRGRVEDTFTVGQEPELLNPNPVSGVATPYRVSGNNIANHGNLTLNTDWTRQFSTTLSYQNAFFDYDNSGTKVVPGFPDTLMTGPVGGPSLAGILNRDEENAALDLKWHLQPETTAFVGYAFTWEDYTGNEPIAVFFPYTLATPNFIYYSKDRNYYEHTIYLGLEEEFTPNLSADIKAGASYADSYADPLFPSTSWNPYADLSASYTYLPGCYVQLGFSHDISATDQVAPDSTGHITQYAEDSVVYLDINHKITQKLLATAIGRVQYSTYHDGAVGNLDTTDYGLGLNLTYQFNPHLSADLGYNYDDVESGIAGYSYTRNRVYLGLTATY